jgi:hypothetical protein
MLNEYVALYNEKRIEVSGPDMTALQARNQAATILRVPAKKQCKISVFLASQDGEPVVHRLEA